MQIARRIFFLKSYFFKSQFTSNDQFSIDNWKISLTCTSDATISSSLNVVVVVVVFDVVVLVIYHIILNVTFRL